MENMFERTTFKSSITTKHIVLLVLTIIVVRWIASMILPMYDDAFITMRYARNLTSGNGLVYNPGEWILGLSCVGFGLLEAFFFLINLPLPQTIVLFNIAVDAILLVVVINLLRKEADDWSALIFAFLFLVSPIASRVCVGGMEENLFTLISIIAIICHVRGSTYAAFVLASCAVFLRAEGFILLGIFGLLELITFRGKRSVLSIGTAAVIIAFGAFAIWNFYGSVIPQSIAAKSSWRATMSIWDQLRAFFLADPLTLLAFPFSCYALALYKKQGFALRIISAWYMLYVMGYIISRAHVVSWYTEVIHVAEFILASYAVGHMLKEYGKNIIIKKILPHSVQRMVVIIGAVSLLFWCAVFFLSGKSTIQVNVYNKLITWLEQHPSERDSIMAGDIGVIGYYSRAYIFDMDGLVSIEHSLGQQRMITLHKPHLLYLNAPGANDLFQQDTTEFKKYELMSTFAVDSSLLWKKSDKWIQQYVLYRRRSDTPMSSQSTFLR